MRFTDNAADAEDVAQEAFISAFRGLHHFRCESTFYTWLYRITINTAKDALNSRNREHADGTIESPNDCDIDHDTPEHLALTDDVNGMVDAGLAALSDAFRAAIILREIDGLSYKEIAAAMAIPVGTVRSRVFRARNFMDRQLRQVCTAGLGRHSK
jgi:RNA polymerase sigma-70 factor (ECF subfamily)